MRMNDPRGPTGHGPGSSGKIDILAERLENGWELWHSGDNLIRTTLEVAERCRALQREDEGPSDEDEEYD